MLKKSMGKSALMVALITGNVIWGGTAVYAEEGLQQFNLDQMVVTATRTMKELQEVPSSVSVVTAQDIEERNINSVPEALQTLPGVYMNQAAQGGITLRGFGSTELLVLVDGQQMNTTYNGSVNFNMIPVENIERIEVLRGAASSIYGGHAVGGVINIITKDAGEGTHVNAVVSYGSNNTWKKALFVDSRINEKVSFGIGYEKRSSDGYRGFYRSATGKKGSNGTYNANLPLMSDGKTYVYGGRGEKDWAHETYIANVKYNFDESKSLKYIFTKTKSESSYNNPFSYVHDSNGKPVFNGSVNTQNGDVITLSADKFYGYENINEKDRHALIYKDEDNKFTAAFSYVDDKIDGFSSPNLPKNYDKIDWTGEGDYSQHPGKIYNFEIEKAWENLGKHTIVTGLNLKQEEMIQHRYNLKHWKNHDSILNEYAKDTGKVKNIAVFVQDEYKISNPVTMYFGARYDHYKKGSGRFWSNKDTGYNYVSEGESYNEISPKLAFDFKADENTNYYISYGHSFNPPPMYQIYRYTSTYKANPSLEPEKSDTFEIGMKKKLNEKTDMGISLYHVKTKDKIGAAKFDAGYSQYINYSVEKRNGIEFEINHKFSNKFSSYLNYAWQSGKTEGPIVPGTNKTQPFSNIADYSIPKHLLHAGINYKYEKWNALLDCQYVSARQSPDVVTGEYGAEDAFFIVNTAVNYEISKGTTLQFTINNLFDREFYCDEATSGRVYSVGLRYSF